MYLYLNVVLNASHTLYCILYKFLIYDIVMWSFLNSCRLACVHCRLYPGWGLQVFSDLIDRSSFDHGVVFTLISPYRSFQTRHHRLRVVTALPWRMCQIFHYCEKHRIPVLSWLFDYRNLMPLYPLLMMVLSYKIKHYKPDTCLISSFAIAKNITVPVWVKTVLYIHSPMQYIRDNYDEYMHKLKGFKKWMFWLVSGYLKRWDLRPRSYDRVYANSQYTASLAFRYYWLSCEVMYPAIHISFQQYARRLLDVGNKEIVDTSTEKYYVCVGRLVTFVRECDRIIRLANRKGFTLYMIWSGPDEDLLKSLAWNTIHFIWHIHDVDKKRHLIAHSSWLINLAKESFWLNTVEALMCWVPVFVYGDWWSLEIMWLVNKPHLWQCMSTNLWVIVGSKDDWTLDSGWDSFVSQEYKVTTIVDYVLSLE